MVWFGVACEECGHNDRGSSMQPGILPVVGGLLVIAGLMFMVSQAVWRGRFRNDSRSFTTGGFGLKANWPGFALIAIGAVLLLAGAF